MRQRYDGRFMHGGFGLRTDRYRSEQQCLDSVANAMTASVEGSAVPEAVRASSNTKAEEDLVPAVSAHYREIGEMVVERAYGNMSQMGGE